MIPCQQSVARQSRKYLSLRHISKIVVHTNFLSTPALTHNLDPMYVTTNYYTRGCLVLNHTKDYIITPSEHGP